MTNAPETGSGNQHHRHKFHAGFQRQFLLPMHDFGKKNWRSNVIDCLWITKIGAGIWRWIYGDGFWSMCQRPNTYTRMRVAVSSKCPSVWADWRSHHMLIVTLRRQIHVAVCTVSNNYTHQTLYHWKHLFLWKMLSWELNTLQYMTLQLLTYLWQL